MTEWYDTGYEGAEAEKERRDDLKNAPRRFFLKPGAMAKVIFLDDFTAKRTVKLTSGQTVDRPIVPFCFDEHQLTIDGDWRNYRTCIGKIEPPCPLCSAGHRKSYMGMYTVLSNWIGEDGSEKWYKNLFPAKLDNIEKLRRQAMRRDGQLQFCLYEIIRTNERSLTTGDDFEFIERMERDDVAALLPDKMTLDVFNYIELFQPEKQVDLKALIDSGRVAPPRGSKQSTNQAQSGKAVNTDSNEYNEIPPDDDIPF